MYIHQNPPINQALQQTSISSPPSTENPASENYFSKIPLEIAENIFDFLFMDIVKPYKYIQSTRQIMDLLLVCRFW